MTREEIELERKKGQETRQRKWEQRMERKRLEEEAARQRHEAARRQDEAFMEEALEEAKKAAAIGDVPIGCVIVRDNAVLSRGYNRRNADKTVLAHGELRAIEEACKKLGDWRLEGCTLYVTLEPCPMCAGAIVQARIPRVVIGAMNPKAGCAGSVLDMFHQNGLNHQVDTEKGVMGEECSAMLQQFFEELRGN